MKRLLERYRMTPLGGALVFILLAAVLVLLLGPPHDEAPALILIVIVLGVVVTSAIGPNAIGWGGFSQKTLERRREEFHPKRRRLGETADAEGDADAWARERERYEAREGRREPDEPGAP